MKGKMSKPTRPNKTKKATAADIVFTPPHVAERIIHYFAPKGRCLDPCKGKGAFYNELPSPKEWCEITEGKDFLEYEGKVDYIITNPPYSIYDLFLEKCFSVADNVILFVPIAKAFKSLKVERMVQKFGGLKEILLMGGGSKYGFGFGFPVGCLYYKRGYKGDCRITHMDERKEDASGIS